MLNLAGDRRPEPFLAAKFGSRIPTLGLGNLYGAILSDFAHAQTVTPAQQRRLAMDPASSRVLLGV